MARTKITINDLPKAGGAPSTNTLTTIDQSNGMYLDVGGTNSLMLVVQNSSTTTAYDLYVLPGVNPPAVRAGLGTLTEEVAAGASNTFETIYIESARHMQVSGQIYINFEASFAGKIAAYRLPKGIS